MNLQCHTHHHQEHRLTLPHHCYRSPEIYSLIEPLYLLNNSVETVRMRLFIRFNLYWMPLHYIRKYSC